jgi:transcription elongation factor GreB
VLVAHSLELPDNATPMSKAFTRESDTDADDRDDDQADALPADLKNYVTPAGHAALQAELRRLRQDERPKVVEVVSWAASNGDRSENADYQYGKKRLREIDRRVRYLTKRLDSAVVVDPRQQQGLEQVFFGATVTYAKADGGEHTVTLVGVDEADFSQRKISWPVAGRAGADEGEGRRHRSPAHAVRHRRDRNRCDPLSLRPHSPGVAAGAARIVMAITAMERPAD